ncbi:DgyrCDS6813 [Dimorphilus gyrociliatus]|uniref:DgyrCDS6813 n=1 Tax=Dimorphilus gyrociliatus TaxID=2664684 RepID=A0A7I8VU00_9ANNE|nr:DgyrCDS6813 [Dimorphilus gyrociliatus]
MSVKGHSQILKKSSNKAQFKEKISQIYESLFKGQDLSLINENFWDELFLLKVNPQTFATEFEKQSIDQLCLIKEIISKLFYECIKRLDYTNPIPLANSLQTINCLIRGVVSKNDDSSNVLKLLIGQEEADDVMKDLITGLIKILEESKLDILHTLSLKLLLTIVTVVESHLSQNILLEYLMKNSLFETIVQLFGRSEWRNVHGHDALLLFTLLVQYRKHESANPYVVKLSILDNELALNGFAQTISMTLTEFNKAFKKKCLENESSGFLATLSSMVGNMFVGDEKKVSIGSTNDAMLLALYEAVHLNRNFVITLTQCHTSPVQTPPESPATTIARSQSMPVNEKEPDSKINCSNEVLPTNLLATFLEYSSIVMQGIKEESRFHSCKLCLLILTCISEDQFANSLMHDVNINFRVPLHKMPMRHRKVFLNRPSPSRTLASALLDLLVEFVHSHMMKNFPMELYMRGIGVIQRVLCYQKRCRQRLKYNWNDLWSALIALLKFIVTYENYLMKQKHDIFSLCYRVINIFNMFITYGDTFLPSTQTYDELYYEIVRTHQVFNNLYTMGLRYSNSNNEFVNAAKKMNGSLVNIRSIVNHFTPKLEKWQHQNKISSLTEEQVLEVVRNNYESLTLKLHDCLDQYERYSEKPEEAAFFSNMVRHIMNDVKKQACPLKMDCYDQFNIESPSTNN